MLLANPTVLAIVGGGLILSAAAASAAAPTKAAATVRYTNERVVLKSRPHGEFSASNLKLTTEEQDLSSAPLEDGEVLVAVDMLSIEAFYRTTLDEEAYHGSTALGQVVPAIGYGRVIASSSKKFANIKMTTYIIRYTCTPNDLSLVSRWWPPTKFSMLN